MNIKILKGSTISKIRRDGRDSKTWSQPETFTLSEDLLISAMLKDSHYIRTVIDVPSLTIKWLIDSKDVQIIKDSQI